MPDNKMEKILKLARKNRVLLPKDVEHAGLPRRYIYRLVEQGALERVNRGVYKLTGTDISENEMLMEVARKIPRAVVCLLSALRFCDMTSQNPYQIWIALHHKDRAPRIDLPVKIIRMTGDALEQGQKIYTVDNIKLRVFNPAKTVADCFKFRNKIGLDVAVEALKDYFGRKDSSKEELWHYAGINRVQKIMRPYLEMGLKCQQLI